MFECQDIAVYQCRQVVYTFLPKSPYTIIQSQLKSGIAEKITIKTSVVLSSMGFWPKIWRLVDYQLPPKTVVGI